MLGASGPGMLAGVRVIEVADELGEYTGLLLAGRAIAALAIRATMTSSARLYVV